MEYDLSSVFFIATANVLHTIPQALQDRLEVIRLPGYTEHEKVEIAQRHLIPKQIKSHGLAGKNVAFGEDALLELVRRYTREAGVRNMEREMSTILRKVARKVVLEGREYAVAITAANLGEYLGVPRYRASQREEHHEIGLATGLAWTEVGGEILPIEVTLMPGKGALRLTGKLGDVMQESAHAAMSFVRSKAEQFGIARDFNRKLDVHIHVPEGAIPKDGPSAGITMCTALVSALTRMPVRRDVAMTGEITLRGKVLPDRRGQGEAPRRPPHRRHDRDHPAREREGPRGRAQERARGDAGAAGGPRRRGPQDRPPAAGHADGAGRGGRGRGRAGHGARRHDPLKRRSPRPRGARRPPATTI